MGQRTKYGYLVLALTLLGLLVVVCSASADLVIGGPGSGPGQYDKPTGVAVDASTGHVYVADGENNRVDVFDEAGAFLFAFGTFGSGAGQFNHLESIAVDSSSHAVYVGETANHRVQKFDSEGHFVWMVGGEVDKVTHANLCTVAVNCGAGKAAEKAAGKEEERFFSTLGKGLQIAVGPEGVLYIVDSRSLGPADSDGFNTRVQRYEPSGAYLGPQLILAGTFDRVQALAVEPSGSFYLVFSGAGVNPVDLTAVRKYDAAGGLVTAWGESGGVDFGGEISALALDPAGNLFVADQSRARKEILEYDPSGAKSHVFFSSGAPEEPPIGLAFHHTATGDLYAAEDATNNSVAMGRVVQLALPAPGPLLVPSSTKASPIGSVKATLKVSFNAENKASKAKFQYITKAQFEADGNSFGAGTLETPFSAETPADFENHTVEATNICTIPTETTCLQPETTYYFRAIASNADGTVEGDKAEFTTRPPLEIGAIWATEVGSDSARLHAEVNPLGFPTGGRFEYVDDAHFKSEGGFGSTHTQTLVGTIDFGSGQIIQARSAQVSSLEPSTVYHYRLIAEDPYFPPAASVEGIFTTFAALIPGKDACSANAAFRIGPSAALPDCRAYELVTPLDKSNGDIFTRLNLTGLPTNLDQSSTSGNGFTYSSYRAFANPQSAPYTSQFLARRDPSAGWSSESLDPPRDGPRFLSTLELENEYRVFSPDLSSAWLFQETEPTLDSCAPQGFADLYRRDNASGTYQALSCSRPSLKFEELAPPFLPSKLFAPEIEGATADGSHAVFRINDALPEDASAASLNESGVRPIYQVYESTGAGGLHLVSVLPNGKASDEDSSAGSALSNDLSLHNRFQTVDRAFSEDGSRVFWSTGGFGSSSLYLRLNAAQKQSNVIAGECTQPARACTIPVSGTVTSAGARFQTANPDGTKALFVVAAGLLKGNLYEFDSSAEPPASELIAEGVLRSILGASEDLSRVYFASEEASGSQQAEGAIEGEPNLYLYEEGTTRFIATLSSGQNSDDIRNGYGSPMSSTPVEHTARVSADGQGLVFMSSSPALAESSAGYDNTDANSGQPAAEVYLYDASANGGAGKLRCVSCNPSGARPVGREIAKGSIATVGFFAAATVPRPYTQHYQPRYLSDDGKRIFFNSFDALVLGDTNGKEDVYQWEANGTGRCAPESVAYVAASEGCLALISSGQSSSDSEFLDASPSGSDAFFTTAEGILPQDYGLIDVYDARANGGFPPPPPPLPACEGDACQSPASPPDDPTPASASFKGAPDPPKAGSARCPSGKRKVRKPGKTRCVGKRKAKSTSKAKRQKHHQRRAAR
jgi:DNA-binding beta-propeller fold protein YncE